MVFSNVAAEPAEDVRKMADRVVGSAEDSDVNNLQDGLAELP
jgi:hypothetical protein